MKLSIQNANKESHNKQRNTENSKAGGFRKKISEYGGIVALALSITIGIFTVYDKAVVQPREDRAMATNELRNDLNTLSNIAAKLAALDWSGNFQAAQAQAQTWTPQRLALLDKIAKLDKQLPGTLMLADRYLLILQYESFGRFAEALEQVELAFKIAEGPFQVADAYWAKARISGGSGDIQTMRDTYPLAVKELRSVGFKTTAFMILQIYLDWIGQELGKGSCDVARQVHNNMLDDYNSSDVWPMTRQEIKKRFNALIASAPQQCGLTQI